MDLFFVERFQTLIAGIFGFSGVIFALLGNAWLTRRQHAREVDHERQILRTALRCELEAVRDAYKDRISTIEKAEQDNSTDVLVPLDTMTDTYGRLLDKIGLLSEDEVRAVMDAYNLVRQMPERVRLLGQQHATRDETERGMALVGSALFAALRQMHQNYLKNIEEAVAALSITS